jgi:hypothetical protein
MLFVVTITVQIKPITRICNDAIEKSFKLLGVLFDEYLSFDDHIASLCSKISKSLYCLNRIKKCCYIAGPENVILLYGSLPPIVLY